MQTSWGQVPTPVDSQEGPVMIIGATAHIGNGNVIENSAVAFEQGKITLVAEAATIRVNLQDYEVINAEGKHVYPGLILPNSQLGLLEVNNVRPTNDTRETGSINPNVRSLIAYNTDSETIPTLRFNGVLLAETTPLGGRISGRSSVMELEGWNWEDAAHSIDVAMHLNWPNKYTSRFDFSTFTRSEEANRDYDDQVEELRSHFLDAKAYKAAEDKVENIKLSSMEGLFEGSTVLMVHADDPKEIVDAVLFAESFDIERIAIITGSGALRVTGFLKDHGVPVIISMVHTLPDRADDDIVLPYKLPNIYHEAGLTVALAHSGMLAHSRNLPFYAGTAAAYGVDKETALQMVTSHTAEILGVADRVGTLEAGKDATLFISEGDALDIRTNILSHAFISGKKIVLDNKQQALFERYSKKYGHID